MMTKKLKRMQVVVVATVTAAVACVLATPAQAAFVTYDDFNGTVLDSAKWSMPDGTYAPAVGDGNLQLVGMTSTSGWGTGVNSTDHFGYGSFKFAFADYAGGGAHIIALNSRQNDGGPIEAVYLRDDTMATNVGKVVVYKNTAPVASTVLDYAPTALPASYTFVYHPDLLAIYRDIGAGDVLLYSTTDLALIPTGTMRFELLTYYCYGQTATMKVDSVAYEVIPEPSAAALLGLGAMALLRRRRSS